MEEVMCVVVMVLSTVVIHMLATLIQPNLLCLHFTRCGNVDCNDRHDQRMSPNGRHNLNENPSGLRAHNEGPIPLNDGHLDHI